MPEFDVEPEEINLFELGDIYVFTHYFDNQKAFSELEPWYNNDEYRFEIPKDDLDQIESILESYLYEPVKISSRSSRRSCIGISRRTSRERKEPFPRWT